MAVQCKIENRICQSADNKVKYKEETENHAEDNVAVKTMTMTTMTAMTTTSKQKKKNKKNSVLQNK